MSLKKIFFFIFSFNILLLLFLGSLAFSLFMVQKELIFSQNRRIDSYKIADELRQSSDDLTRFARTYVVTGNPFYEKLFNNILAIRNGDSARPENYERIYWDLIIDSKDLKIRKDGDKNSIINRMIQLGFTEIELLKLEEAKKNSDNLVNLENIAMNMVKGIYKDKEGNFTKKGFPDQKKAIEILHSKEYHLYKKEIMFPIDEFFQILEKRTEEDVKEKEKKSNFLISCIIILIIIIIASVLFSFKIINEKVSRPIYSLTTVATEIGNQNWDIEISYSSKDEIGLLANAFRILKDKIFKLISEINISYKNLIDSNLNLKNTLDELKSAQSQLIQSEKMASLGQLIAGVAHEINTPLGAIKTSNSNLAEGMSIILNFPKHELSQLEISIFNEILEYSNIKKIKTQLGTKEKRKLKKEMMENFLELELVNPETICDLIMELELDKPNEFWKEYLKINKNIKNLEFLNKISKQFFNSNNIDNSVDRASKIVYALKSYTYKDSKGEKIKFSLIDNIETVFVIYNNLIKKGIDIIKKYEFKEEIMGYPDELSQVWTNLIHNSIQAMNNQGNLTISIKKENANFVLVQIEDSGNGISIENQSKIFDAFFTTKPIGEGTGLGLGIVKKIVEKHGGQISLQSEVEKGTIFSIRLPI